MPPSLSRAARVASPFVLVAAGTCLALAAALPPAPAAPTAPGPVPAARLAAARVAATDREVVVAAVGDTILGSTPVLASRPRHWFADIRASLTAGDPVVFGNLEGTFTDQTASKCGGGSGAGCYAFRNPPSFAAAYADVGFDVLNDANNHSMDFGRAGLSDTVRAVDAAGVKQTGLPGEITHTRSNGIRVAWLGFAPYSWSANLLDLDRAASLVRRAAAHADVVVVYMHAGAEGTAATHVTGHEEHYLGEDRGNPERFAHRMVRAGADLVLGSGPHVLRGMEFYRNRLIAYSLGNSASYRNFDTSGILGDSVILRVRLGPHGGFRSGRLVPVRLDAAGHPAPGGAAKGEVRALSRADFGVRAARISRTGRISPPA
jgi:hypothetical protein